MDIGMNSQQIRPELAQGKSQPAEKTGNPAVEQKAARQIAADLKEGRVSGVSGADRVETPENRTQKSAERPTRDRYVPEKPEDRASFGSYQKVSDGEGGTKIRFDAPTDGKDGAKTQPDAPADGEDARSEKTADAPQEQKTDAAKQSPKSEQKAESSDGSSGNAMLQKKLKALEKQLKTTADPEARKEIKKKLEQIKRQLKTAKK